MNIFISGVSGGMGSAIAKILANDDHVFFLQYKDEKKKKSLVAQFSACKGAYHYLNADLIIQKQVDQMLGFVNQNGGADIVVHSVSLPTKTSDLDNKSWEDFEGHLSLQVKSLFHIVKGLSPGMKQKRFGRIIALASEYTISRPPAKLVDYVTAKYAMVGLVKSLAVELGAFGITANCISSGLASTDLTNHLPSKLKEIVALQTPLKKLTTPEDVASLVKFLTSPGASMITGENILINGGYTMR